MLTRLVLALRLCLQFFAAQRLDVAAHRRL